MAKPARSPFDIKLTDEQKTAVGQWLTMEIDNAQDVKASSEREVDYWWQLYEQARTRVKNLPWPDAADLTSYIPCEKVDAIQARLMRTVWVNPVWTVEGWGQAAERAPFVEEFHQWKAEEERLQSVLDKASLMALVEPRVLLEISESSERRTSRKTIAAKPVLSPMGGFVYDEQGNPTLETGPDGAYVEAQANEMAVNTVIDSNELVRTGPQYRVIPYRDSVVMPGHARDEQEIWGYGKRFWKRLSDLKQLAKAGVYDADVVDLLNSTGDREGDPSLARAGMAVSPQRPETAEKELWEAMVLVDLNTVLDSQNQDPLPKGSYDGARWYLATVHTKTSKLLRLKHDDGESHAYVNIILFPRPDRAAEGYSFVGHKLITTTEEHTSYRNMSADATSKAINAPIFKMAGALWDEDEQPMGPKSVITVRSPQEITPMQMPDVPASIFEQIQYADRTAERLAGVNDIASGQTVGRGDPTLGEVQMATEQSFVRMDLIVRRFQEKLEDVAQVRHAIWKRVLAEQPTGVDAPESVLVGLEGRGVSIDSYLPDGKITAALLDGPFRFKPYGSVETADTNRQRQDFVSGLQVLGPLLQAFPMLAMMFQTPQAARAMGRQYLRVFRIPNPQAFLGSPSQDMSQQMAIDQLPMPAMAPPPGMGMPGMMPQGTPGMGSGPQGLPPGGPPMGGMPPPMAPGPMGPQ